MSNENKITVNPNYLDNSSINFEEDQRADLDGANDANKLSDQVVKLNSNITNTFNLDLTIGIVVAIVVSLVIFGGLKRIAEVASRLVPLMVLVYLSAGLFIVFSNFSLVPSIVELIFVSAFKEK